MSINKVTIIGNLGNDPEISFMPSGECVANFTVATNERWTDKASGERKELVEWHRCSAFGKTSEIIGSYAKKGTSCYLEGKLRTRKYTDKEGVERYTTEIIVREFQMLGRKEDQDAGNQG